MVNIKFGTDGWRAIIAKDYTVDNVKRVSKATADWLNAQADLEKKIIIGYDCRFGGPLFTNTAIAVFCENGIKVLAGKSFVTTPMVSMGANHYNCGLGIVITASHNPPDYNGFKIKANFGGPASVETINQVEALIPESYEASLASIADYEAKGMIEYVDLEDIYYNSVKEAFDLELVNSTIGLGYDAMYGAGQSVIKKICPNASYLHCDYNPSFKGQAPEPLDKNLQELSKLLAADDKLHVGLANDGDADRIGMYDGDGLFVDSHHLILLLVHYLHKVKGYDGKVVIAASVTKKVNKLCAAYGLPVEVTKVGFKYIAGKMITDDVLLGGEESGGIAVKGHVPERDGIWVGLLLMEFMAKSGKSMKELIQEIYDIVGPFFYKRNDLRITEELKLAALEKCKAGIGQFGDFKVLEEDTTDGYKYIFENEQWLMIRASGTEPVLRVYAESADEAGANLILEAAEKTLIGS